MKIKKNHPQLSEALINLQIKLSDIVCPLSELEKDVKKIKARVKKLSDAIFSIQKKHGHLKNRKGE